MQIAYYVVASVPVPVLSDLGMGQQLLHVVWLWMSSILQVTLTSPLGSHPPALMLLTGQCMEWRSTLLSMLSTSERVFPWQQGWCIILRQKWLHLMQPSCGSCYATSTRHSTTVISCWRKDHLNVLIRRTAKSVSRYVNSSPTNVHYYVACWCERLYALAVGCNLLSSEVLAIDGCCFRLKS